MLNDALKYESRAAWKRSSYGYECAVRYGWLDEACKHMSGGKGKYQKGYWTLQRCARDAKQYVSKLEWRNAKGPSGYTVAKLHGWLETCCNHMPVTKRPNGHWKVYENCLTDALRFNSLTKWEMNSGAAVNAARRNGWIDRCISHMPPPEPRAEKWTLELIKVEAARYLTLSEWRHHSHGSYKAAHRKGMLGDVVEHMLSMKSLGEHEIRKFLIARDIRFSSEKRFLKCKDKRLLPFDFYLPDFNLLVEFQGPQHRLGWYRDIASARDISRRDAIKRRYALSNGYEFLEVWVVKNIPSILTQSLVRIAKKDGYVLKCKQRPLTLLEERRLATFAQWNLASCKASAAEFVTKSDWQKNASSAYATAHKNGWIGECCSHMTALWFKKWTLDTLKSEASKYETKKEWKNKSPNSYAAAHKKLLVELCSSHMVQLRKPNHYWTKIRCSEEAKKFKNKMSWRKGSASSYVTAKRNGWLKDCGLHMRSQGRS